MSIGADLAQPRDFFSQEVRMQFKEISVAEAIQNDPRLAATVNQANDELLKKASRTSSEVVATWTLTRDQNKQPLLCLSLVHPRSSVEGRFSPDDLDNPSKRYWELSNLWGDLLQQVSHEYLKDLRQTVSQLEGD